MQAAAVNTLSTVTKDLSALLRDENTALKGRNVGMVEQNVQQKADLASKLEATLAKLKAEGAEKGDPMLKEIQEDMAAIRDLGRKNATLLQVAHQTRVDTLNLIRDVMAAEQPKAQYYSANGDVNQTQSSSNLVNKSA